jgi:hypothetical protein
MEKLKKITPKKLLVWSTYLLLSALIVVLTAVPVNFDIENLDVTKWVTNSLINMGIMIASIVLGEISGDDKQKEKVGGLYQNALKRFNDKLVELTDRSIIIYFSQFYIWFKAKELKQKKIGYLIDNGIDQQLSHLIVEYITRDELDSMKEENLCKTTDEGKIIKFRKIHDDEYEIIKEIFKPTFVINAPEYTYYLSAFGDSTSVSTLEQAKKIETKERSNKIFNRTFKIVLALFISFVWGTATIADAVEGGGKVVAVNMATRILALVGGALSGYMTSVIAVKLASQKLDNKTQVLVFFDTFYKKGDFRPKTYEEIVEEEIQQEKQIEEVNI